MITFAYSDTEHVVTDSRNLIRFMDCWGEELVASFVKYYPLSLFEPAYINIFFSQEELHASEYNYRKHVLFVEEVGDFQRFIIFDRSILEPMWAPNPYWPNP